jgi:hypothetical protein
MNSLQFSANVNGVQTASAENAALKAFKSWIGKSGGRINQLIDAGKNI